MNRPRHLAVLPYLGAVAVVAAAVMIRFALDPILQGRQLFAVFYVAVVVVARYCGFFPSLLALFLGALASRYFFVQPRGSLVVTSTVEEVSFWFSVLIGLLLAFLLRAEQRVKRDLKSEIAERTKVENALRDSEERFRVLVTKAPVGIAQVDAEGGVFFANSKWCELAGVAPSEAMGFAWKEFVHPEDRTRVIDHWRTYLQAGQDMPAVEFRFLHRDGQIRWASSSIAMLKDPTGRITGQIVSEEDITERKVMEDDLRDSEERFRAFMDNSPVIVWAKDEQGRHVYLNKAYERQFQVHFADWKGKTDFEVWPQNVAELFWENDQKVLKDGTTFQTTERSESVGKKSQYWLNSKFLFQDRWNRRFVGGVGIDITELKQTEDELRTKEEVLRNVIEVQEKERKALCREFHDGLMQYAIGSQMALSSCLIRHPSPEASATIQMVIDNLRKGVEDGRRAMRGIRPAALDDFGLEAALHDLADQQSSSDFLVKYTCDPEIGRLSNAIETTVFRIVQEALNNARKHSGAGAVTIDLKQDGDELRLEVRDFGCGFDVESGRKRGFGLLGITERVRLFGGECLVQSELNIGTRIFIRLPISTGDSHGEIDSIVSE